MLFMSHLPQGLALTLILLAGCAGNPPNEASAGVRENGLLVLTRADNNRTAELRVGERLEVRLPENPSTGFSWAVDENDRRLLALEDTAYALPVEAGFIGARGQRTFSFTARQPGDVALKLKYWRVWEGDGSVTERLAVTLRIVQ
jgi:inhibitor of cysteine peptidase